MASSSQGVQFPSPAMLTLNSWLRKASEALGIASPEPKPPPLDGEIIYCKNNVCVHPPALLTQPGQHFPGYLNIRSQIDSVLDSTLLLTWIPNSTLRRNPRSLENSPAHANPPRITPRRSPRQEFAHPEYASSSSNEVVVCNNTKSIVANPCGGVGCNVNDLHAKESNVEVEKNCAPVDSPISCADLSHDVLPDEFVVPDTSPSSGSTSPATERQLFLLTSGRAASRIAERERAGSNRSVTSVEMEGDNLVVVTESITDSVFECSASDEFASPAEPTSPRISHNCTNQMSNRVCSDDEMCLTKVNCEKRQCFEDSGGAVCTVCVTTVNDNTEPDSSESVTDCASDYSSLQTVDRKTSIKNLKRSLELDLANANSPLNMSSGTRTSSSDSGATSGPDSRPATPVSPIPTLPDDALSPTMNLTFPHNHVAYTTQPDAGSRSGLSAAEQVCGVFSVDLGQMRSLRIFYDETGEGGQLVIASRESQYKILHFHHGGLDRLAEVFDDWQFLAAAGPKRGDGVEEGRSRHFSVIRPYLPQDEEAHPQEGTFEPLTLETWREIMNESGEIEDDSHLRKVVFFAGVSPPLRSEVWPFLLQYFPFHSTHEQRDQIRNDKYIEYQNIRKSRDELRGPELHAFWRGVQCIVEKDVVRTDRSHPYFKGQDNPNITVLQDILLNYAHHHPSYGYTQGMSDLLAPILAEIQNEADAYWCFTGLMQKTLFFSTPKDADMESQLHMLCELLRELLPRFHSHLTALSGGLELLFCHRWILLCFKREFVEEAALRIWEACWTWHVTAHWHLFVCVAIMAVYGEDVLTQGLGVDDMLLHFSSLSMHMNAAVVVRKARALLHQLRAKRQIPCTLKLMYAGADGHVEWDSGHEPALVCTKDHADERCPYGADA